MGTLLNTLATVRNYEVSRSLSFDKLYSTLAKSAKKHGIVAWELTHSTLEEVFLNVVAQHQPAAAAVVSKKGVASDSSYEYESVYETASPSDSEVSSQESSRTRPRTRPRCRPRTRPRCRPKTRS